MMWDLEIAKVFELRIVVDSLKSESEKESVLRSRNVKESSKIAAQTPTVSIKKLLMIIELVQSNFADPSP